MITSIQFYLLNKANHVELYALSRGNLHACKIYLRLGLSSPSEGVLRDNFGSEACKTHSLMRNCNCIVMIKLQ